MNHFYHNAFQKRRRSNYRVTCALSSTISLRTALGILVMTILSGWLMHSKHLHELQEIYKIRFNEQVPQLPLLVTLNYADVRSCYLNFQR
ncbi:hypothetical protein M758_5G123300 [Ceratodon purpureus]|nr:hypothetical protein M758_5G123300 [Ceratodon purpureus]